MTILNKKAAWVLLAGDVAAFILSLWLTLLIRYAVKPEKATFLDHLAPFSVLFLVWLLVFFIFGLYDKQSVVFKSRVPVLLTQAQVANMLIATAFFYFIPWYGISPKTTLFLYLLVSLGLILLWRIYGYFIIVPRSRERAILIGRGREMAELSREIRENRHYNIDIADTIDLERGGLEGFGASAPAASLVVIDLSNDKVRSALPRLYNLLFSRIRFIEMDEMYENVFDRVPLSLVQHHWFLENVSTSPKLVYDTLKRCMDIVISLVLGLLSLVLYPLVYIAIKLDDGGPIFIVQDRVGQNGGLVKIFKFRSMARNETDLSKGLSENYVTRVGRFLRKSRIDELPQLWNVLRGDMSLVGPRPPLPEEVDAYRDAVNRRLHVRPGLTGLWQVSGRANLSWEESVRLDLRYVDNWSVAMDLLILWKTGRAVFGASGAY